jgi:hypothetical protein
VAVATTLLVALVVPVAVAAVRHNLAAQEQPIKVTPEATLHQMVFTVAVAAVQAN